MRRISASEISTFSFCTRAWWYQNQGIESGNLEAMAAGRELHHQHSRAVVASGLIKILAYISILAALIIFLVHLILLVV
jgi:CRISPR/Cas system-associated exonuclease Cas4 (RecB family)